MLLFQEHSPSVGVAALLGEEHGALPVLLEQVGASPVFYHKKVKDVFLLHAFVSRFFSRTLLEGAARGGPLSSTKEKRACAGAGGRRRGAGGPLALAPRGPLFLRFYF